VIVDGDEMKMRSAIVDEFLMLWLIVVWARAKEQKRDGGRRGRRAKSEQ
jgi:hypothetical protein